MKTLERCRWRHSSAFIVNHEHTSSFVLIAEFERETFAGFILKLHTFRDKIVYITRYVAVFSV